MSESVVEQLRAMRDKSPDVWVLEMYDPAQGRTRAYIHEMTKTQRSEAISPWVILLGPTTLEVCQRERDMHRDASQLRIRNTRNGALDK